MTLRLVRDEPPRKRPRGRRERVFNVDEERALRAALKTLHGAYGTWACLAEVMGMSSVRIEHAARGHAPVSAEVAIRAARAARKPLEELLVPAPRRVA